MNEIRIRERTFLLGIALISLVIFYLVLVDQCEPQSNYKYSERPKAEHISGKVRSSQPITIYAVTPTYARPVQKAELTRYVIL